MIFFFKALFFSFPCLEEVNLFQKSKTLINIDSTNPPTRKGGEPPPCFNSSPHPHLVPQFEKVHHAKGFGLLQKLELHHTRIISPLPPPCSCSRTPYVRASCLAVYCACKLAALFQDDQELFCSVSIPPTTLARNSAIAPTSVIPFNRDCIHCLASEEKNASKETKKKAKYSWGEVRTTVVTCPRE